MFLTSPGLLKFYVLLGLMEAVAGKVSYDLALNTANISPDGFSREAITVNGVFPSPLISAHKFDRIAANVSDGITSSAIRQSTSIHWHGLFQHRTQTEDGAAFITQCTSSPFDIHLQIISDGDGFPIGPISPGQYYNYDFNTAGQTGTYWYHSHHGTQYCDGLRGPLVIYDDSDPLKHLYDVDDASTVITLADWYHEPAEQAFANKDIIAPTPDSILINGKGRYPNGPANDLAVINVRRGKRYRFRLVNVSCFTFLTVSIDNHKFTVIEADGIEHQPHEVDSLTIFAGQRYSIVVEADQPVNNYWFRTVPTPAIKDFHSGPDPGLNNAIFRYKGAPTAEPTTIPVVSTKPLREADLIPLIDPGAPGGSNPPDVAINLVIGLDVPNWKLNGASFFPPSVPVLLQILSRTSAAQNLLPAGSVYTLPKNKVIEISIPDVFGVERTHPFHLHGHTFDVIKSAGQTKPNYVNPPRRDVVAVSAGNVTFRFKTDNSGPWILHCHIDWHFSQGLAVVLAEDPRGIALGPESAKVPAAWKNLCDAYDALPSSSQ